MLAYLDDVTLVGPLRLLSQAIRFIKEKGSPLGLVLSATKSVVWAPFTKDLAINIEPELCQVSMEQQIELLGGGVATHPSLLQEIARKRVTKFQQMVEVALKMGDPQLCLMLLRQCIGMPKLNYCWRVMPPSTLCTLAQECDDTISSALNFIITESRTNLSEESFNLASLPIALSGLGIDRPSHVLRFAHLAARRDTLSLRSKQFGTLLGPDHIGEQLEGAFLAHLPESIRNSTLAGRVRGGLHLDTQSCQRDLARLHDTSKHASLLANGRFSQPQKYILTATAKATHKKGNRTVSLASQFLLAMPNAGFGQTMEPAAYRAALKFRMLMVQHGPTPYPCPRPHCRQIRDPFGYHMLGCRGKGNGSYQRHNAFAQELCVLADSVGITARYNAKEGHTAGFSGARQHQYADFRPGDLVFLDPRQPVLCIDLTIGSPLSEARRNSADGNSPGLLMAKVSNKKHRQYDAAVALHGKTFKVFAVDVAGFTNMEAIHILKLLTGAYCRTHHITFSHAYTIITRRVSFILMKHLAHQLLSQ